MAMTKQRRGRGAMEQEYYRAVGAKIREVRLARGMSQDVLARAVGMRRPNLCRAELDGYNLTILRVVQIAKSLDVSVATLIRVHLFDTKTEATSCVVQKTL